MIMTKKSGIGVARYPIPIDDLRKLVPSAFADAPEHGVSDKYEFMSTEVVINQLGTQGFLPVYAAERRKVVKPQRETGRLQAMLTGYVHDDGDHQKHIIRFQSDFLNNALPVGINGIGSVPEIIMVNSHDRTTAMSFMVGMFRFACSNGLIVGESLCPAFKVKHIGDGISDFKHRLNDMLDRNLTVMFESVNRMAHFDCDETSGKILAASVMKARWGDDEPAISPGKALWTRRRNDEAKNLWTVMNVVQENVIRGGMKEDYKGRAARAIRGLTRIESVVDVNRVAWEAAEAIMDGRLPDNLQN